MFKGNISLVFYEAYRGDVFLLSIHLSYVSIIHSFIFYLIYFIFSVEAMLEIEIETL
ncbi:hypothetical protein [Borrelia persica]|uniref:hypothetical protein n=1 Tax=Borrelia persica TaxID=44448 RepID=UPI0004B35BAA|nr:hypothetical protein [Borrelia persica]